MSEQDKPAPSPFEKLRAFGRQILSVPKADVVRALAKEKQQRAAKRKAR